MADGKQAKIHHNILAGSEYIGEAFLGGGIITDHACIGFDIEDNILMNTTGTLISTANSKRVNIRRNIGVMTQLASDNLMVSAKTALTYRGEKAVSQGEVYALMIGPYVSSHAKDIEGQKSKLMTYFRIPWWVIDSTHTEGRENEPRPAQM